MQGLKVKCPVCKRIFYETTENYVSGVRPNGSFVRLIDPWRSWHWDSFHGNSFATTGTLCADMLCIGCSSPLAPGGHLTVLPSENIERTKAKFEAYHPELPPRPKGRFVCPVCGRVCGSVGGLGAHMRTHKND